MGIIVGAATDPTFWQQMGETVRPALIIVTTWAVAWITNKYQARKVRKPHPLLEAMHGQDRQINFALEKVRERLGAQRVYLAKLFNGDYYTDNSEILKQNRTHEVVRPGSTYESGKFTGLLVTRVPEEMKLVTEEGSSYRKASEMARGYFRTLCEQGGVRAVARCAIRQNGAIVAFVGADFDDEERPANIDDLCSLAFEMGQLMTRKA